MKIPVCIIHDFSGIRHSTPNAQRPTPNAQGKTARTASASFGCWGLGVGRWALNPPAKTHRQAFSLTRDFSRSALLFIATLLSCATLTAATLVRDGKPSAVIALPPEPTEFETLAAKELTTHIEKMSGVKLETATVDAAGADAFAAKARGEKRSVIFIGRNVAAKLEKLLGGKAAVRGVIICVRMLGCG